MERNGILAAGNFIVDRVKVVEGFPQEGQLSSILREKQANGGGAYNVLKDLAAMGAEFPLHGLGLVGDDADGEWILADCLTAGIDVGKLGKTKAAATSYTDVMSVASTGKRTFFHQRGANRHFDLDGFDFGASDCRIFHLAYLMLLDRMDEWVGQGRTRASVALEAAQASGLRTAVDLVSTPHPEFAAISRSAMPYADYFIANEVEAGWILGEDLVGAPLDRLADAAVALRYGNPYGAVIIHSEDGAVAVGADGQVWSQAALTLPEGFVKGSVGAGDAFAAGLLHGIHEDWDLGRSLQLGVCVAASSLRDETPSAGVLPVADCLELLDSYGTAKGDADQKT